MFPGKKLEAKHGRLDIWKCCTSKLKERGSASRKPLPDGGRPARASGPIRTSHAWSRLDESGTSFSVNPFVDFLQHPLQQHAVTGGGFDLEEMP